MMGFATLNPPYELVNLSIFAIPRLNQIKDLVGAKIAKTGNIHILYGHHSGRGVLRYCISGR
jgi:hypothetical protein